LIVPTPIVEESELALFVSLNNFEGRPNIGLFYPLRIPFAVLGKH
jgi:hypothetical protein